MKSKHPEFIAMLTENGVLPGQARMSGVGVEDRHVLDGGQPAWGPASRTHWILGGRELSGKPVWRMSMRVCSLRVQHGAEAWHLLTYLIHMLEYASPVIICIV